MLVLSDLSNDTISSDSKIGRLSCLIELSQWSYVRIARRDYHNSLRVLRAWALVEEGGT